MAAAAIASGVGGLFFAAASVFYYQPSFIKPEKVMDAVLTTNQSKARAAVTRLLINPSSAEFDGLRSVEADGAKYVCGSVRARDRTGADVGHRAFVYTVSIDFARIDDDGSIAQRHDAYRACPVSIDEERTAQKKMTISPSALQAVKTIQKALPAADTATLSGLTGGSSGVPAGAGGTMQQQLQNFTGQPSAGSTGQQDSGSFKAAAAKAADDEASWRADKPPAAWPIFPSDHPLSRRSESRTAGEALALARDVEERWARNKSTATAGRPSVEDIRAAERALLAIDPKSPDFARAWAAFVRLRTLEREAAS
ncbi:hypothetical protein [Tardiphaga alba]|nr:hypothetical protein [Tardiphaga alba]